MPARCSTLGSTANFGSKHAMVASLTSGTSYLPAMTSTGAGNGMLHGAGRIGASTSTSCSTYVLSGPREGSVAGASAINTNPQCSTSFPRFGGTNPCLWRAQCLEYFIRFNIQKCMWVVAATMHMEGKAKVWYEAYKLRQAVGDWPEFMDTVEAHFGVEDLPPATPIVGAAHPGLLVLPGTSISPTMPIRLDSKEDDTGDVRELFDGMPVWDPEPQDHTKQHDAYELIPDNSAEILTQVGGVSLFLELVMESTEDAVCDGEIAESVLTHVIGWPLFMEHDMDILPRFQKRVDTDNKLYLGVGLNKLLPYATNCVKSSLPWDPGKHDASCCPYVTSVIKLEQGKRENCSRRIHMFADTVFVLIQNFDVVLDCTRFWPTQVKLGKYCIEAGPLSIFLCEQPNNRLKAGYAYIMEDALETLVPVSFPCTSTSPRVIIWPRFSLEENVQEGIMHMRTILHDHGYMFYSQFLIKGSLGEFSVMVNSAQFFCDIQSGGLDRKLQYSPWNHSVHNQMIIQVQQELCMCYYFCSLIHLANHLQYKQWDPGVTWILDAEGIKRCSARPRGTTDRISWLRRRFLYRSWSCSLLQSHRAIAWGQAMFFRGGNVMTAQIDALGLVTLGLGPALLGDGWMHRSI